MSRSSRLLVSKVSEEHATPIFRAETTQVAKVAVTQKKGRERVTKKKVASQTHNWGEKWSPGWPIATACTLRMVITP
jgi:hypothetical protein